MFLAAAIAACSPSPDSQTAAKPETPTATEFAQSVNSISIADYQRAESRLSANTTPLVHDVIVASYWQTHHPDTLLYRKTVAEGFSYHKASISTGSNEVFLDLERLKQQLLALSQQAEESGVDLAEETQATAEAAEKLELSALQLDESGGALDFSNEGQRYSVDLSSYALIQLEDLSEPDEYLSPDKRKAVFIREHNLWLRDVRTNVLTQLTFDGVENYGYGTNNAGWIRDDGPVLKWSEDSSRFASFRHDSRNVGDMALWNTQVGHSEIDVWKYPLPGDDAIFTIERLVVSLEETEQGLRSEVIFLDMPADDHRTTIADHVAGRGGEFLDVQWSSDASLLSFISTTRDHKTSTLRTADPTTGAVSEHFGETVATYYESGSSTENWYVFDTGSEALWFSERDNWGHLYLYDLQSGELKRQVTSGNWAVMQLQVIDEANREIYFTAAGKETGDPYHHRLYRVGIDGGEIELLTSEAGHHTVSWSQDKAHFLDTWSTPQEPPKAAIKTRSGEVVMRLEQADIAALLATGWQAPEAFSVKARDQQTDLYGLLYKPENFDAGQSYPVLNYLYPGPQSGSIGSRSFRAARADKQALAELGFIVIEVDAMGTPGRSKSFHDIYYGNMGDNGLPDQITAIQQLAERYSWIDVNRVGIWGHSGGGFASTAGLLRYPDFYKVAVSGAGNHDNRNYEDDWGEKWQGLLVEYPENNPSDGSDSPTTNYDNQANQLLVDDLQGKLLLAHGLMDSNVHPSNTLLVVDALIEAEKDFDLLILPNAGHGFGNRRYFMKRRWDYFVEHLLGLPPVADFRYGDNIP